MDKFIGHFELEGYLLEHMIIEAEDTHKAVGKLRNYLEENYNGIRIIEMGVTPFKSVPFI